MYVQGGQKYSIEVSLDFRQAVYNFQRCQQGVSQRHICGGVNGHVLGSTRYSVLAL